MSRLLLVPLLVVLTDRGVEREGLPVFARHPENARVVAQLSRGLPGELMHVYRMIQVRRQRTKGVPIEPAYLLLSTRQGGFARYGFWLGRVKKSDVAYVDVHRDWKLTGQFGAVDQIFPHELAHAIVHQLTSARESGGSNQVHAIGVRTDRLVAFNEGFAEHLQIMAVDHPDAAPETRALANRRDLDEAASRHLDAYRRELTSRFAPFGRMRMGFPLWYSNDERALRYFAVKRDAFARETTVSVDGWPGYLLENTVPGGGPRKSAARLVASEGAVSAFFHRWATNRALQERYREDGFYASYGASREITPLQNVYLKLFHAMEAGRAADLPSLLDAYRSAFPDEPIESLPPLPPEIWVANADFNVGTSLFDQFRGAPRVHTFDVNAASIVDLVTIPGMTRERARAILAAGPYRSIADLPPHFRAMAAAMPSVSVEEDFSFRAILLPYAWRAGIALLIAAFFGALLYRVTTHRSWMRSVLSGLGAAWIGVPVAWISGSFFASLAAVAILFGLPSALLRRRLAPLAVWAATALPAAVITTPWVS